ncbi:GNAT family acetyltransferase [Methylobacterium gnaphalii]|uniref:GNAT family acetyltransferase n=1 Tax=Methylobacterium gnaphalii TaxID=1010610 RepID=A0A512JKC5_9HYPH|nr:GNAT family acetyltransferase [Methylobacterium gnaphalii]GEP10407.1 GNAT family acetyltransferase [Methylobacterium gnaphalii]GJD69196.1 Acetyltransferase YpeA [Methylobacterium gnaphalii]GLS47745.1 GNAT family acetyltransferase [Methylobacterium gnaphalii]
MDGTLSIRALTDADRGSVKALWITCGLVVPYNDPDADIDLAAGRENSDILVGTLADHGVVASAMVGHDGHRGWLYYVAVDPAHRDAGFGRVMVRAGEDWLRARGIRKAQLLVRKTNTAVRAFYERIGWAESPRTVMERWL